MPPYTESFSLEDRERVFRFLATFSRWECALKHNGFARRGAYGQAEPDWRTFASIYDQAIAELGNPDFEVAKKALFQHPPRREELSGGEVQWRRNPRRQGETTDSEYLFRIVKDV